MRLKKNILFGAVNLLLLFSFTSFSQKFYFDKNGNSSPSENAYYYKEFKKGYYISNAGIYFEGDVVLQDQQNDNNTKHRGKCTWFYKNGSKKEETIFNLNGIKDGLSYKYFENGNISFEANYKNGKPEENTYKEFNEDGTGFKITDESFENNHLDWELYASDKSIAQIAENKLIIKSLTKEGTSRYINFPITSDDYILEYTINFPKESKNPKGGLLFNFKDWQNHRYFFITNENFYIGSVYEGITTQDANEMYSASINKDKENNLKIFADEDAIVYTINGEVVFKTEDSKSFGSGLGFAINGKNTIQVQYIKLKLPISSISSNPLKKSVDDKGVVGTGTGLLFNAKGYIITNYHVVENNKKIIVEVFKDQISKSYEAKVISQDKTNDLAIIKISDSLSDIIQTIDYSFKNEGNIDIGASAFTIGYPLALGGMGKDAKFTDGKISAKTGYENALNSFQTSIPVQPGNSGGPVFDDKSQLIGIINSKISEADNVSYAIKLNYVKNLIETLPETITFPKQNTLSDLKLEDKIKQLLKYVVLIKIK